MRKGTVDLVFANEAELHSLYQTVGLRRRAEAAARAIPSFGVVTRSEKGCVVAAKDRRRPRCRRSRSTKLVDTTGAGDLFAAGFLFGLVRDAGHEDAGRLGALAAAEVIQHIGARPQVSLKELAEQNGLPVVAGLLPPPSLRAQRAIQASHMPRGGIASALAMTTNESESCRLPPPAPACAGARRGAEHRRATASAVAPSSLLTPPALRFGIEPGIDPALESRERLQGICASANGSTCIRITPVTLRAGSIQK